MYTETVTGSEPFTTAYMKNYLRIDFSDDDTLIDDIISGVRKQAENMTGRNLIARTVVEKFDKWCDPLELRFGRVSAVSSITYLDEDRNSQTLSTDVYAVDTTSVPGKVYRKEEQTWPTLASELQPITITYTVAAEDLPDVKNAMRLMVSKLYEFREGWVEKLPDAARNILGNNYVWHV